MNFIRYKYPHSYRGLACCYIVQFSRYAGEGTRKMTAWLAPITRIKEHKLQVFIPSLNQYEWVRKNQVLGFESMTDDTGDNSRAIKILLLASAKIKELAEEYNAGS